MSLEKNNSHANQLIFVAEIGFIQSGLAIYDTFFRLLSLLLNDADILKVVNASNALAPAPNIFNLNVRGQRFNFKSLDFS